MFHLTTSSTISVSICSTIFNDELRTRLAAAHFSPQQTMEIEGAIELYTRVKEDAAVIDLSVSQSVNAVFILPIVVGVLAFIIAVVQPWQRIHTPGEESSQEKESAGK
jgi:dethiobiotin synthetase